MNLREANEYTTSELMSSMNINNAFFDKYYSDKARKAIRRQLFFEQRSHGITQCLIEDLAKYLAMADLQRIKMVTINEFVSSFLKRITDIHNNPVHIKFKDKLQDNKRKVFSEILEEHIQFRRFVPKNNRRTKLHGTNLVYVRYNERFDEIYLDYMHEGNCIVYTYKDYPKRPVVVVYSREIKGENNKKRYIVWNDHTKEHYYMDIKTLPNFNYDIMDFEFEDVEELHKVVKTGFGENKKDTTSPSYFPFVAYRFNDDSKDFWSGGMDGLIEISRIINVLLTITGDDSIQETMKILLLNFDPTKVGKNVDSGTGDIQTGMRHPFFPRSNKSGTADFAPNVDGGKLELGGKIVQGELYTDEVFKFIEGVVGMISSLNNVDSIFSEQDMQRVYAEALRLKKETQLKEWQEQVDLLKKQDKLLLQTVLDVHDHHRGGKEKVYFGKGFVRNELILEYQKPKFQESEQIELANERIKWEAGLSNPVKYHAKKQSMSEEEAKKDIENNLSITEKVLGRINLSITEPKPENQVDQI